MSNRVVLITSTLIGLLLGAPGARAQSWVLPRTDTDFRIESEVAQGKRGSTVRGYIYNSSGYSIGNIRLIVEGVDGAGQIVGTNVVPTLGVIPPFGRLYFEAPAPNGASNYRVRVGAWEPVGRGGA
jgi:hypothetical protein